MSTFDQLATIVSRDLRDSAHRTFDTTVIADMINMGLAEVGRLAPDRFQQDITPVPDTLSYVLNTSGDAEIELRRVEIWNWIETPHRFLASLRPAHSEYVNSSTVGWEVWDGTLYLNNAMVEWIDVAAHKIRVWGYGPYPVVSGSTVMPVSYELEQAIRVYCRVAALERLQQNRNLFTQWQTSPQATDVGLAQLAAELSRAQDDWRSKSRAITRLREAS